jgi:hypothetical protein
VGGGDAEPAAGLPRRHGRPVEREEDLLGDVLGLVARAEDPGGDADDPLVLAPEDRVQVAAHRARHGRRRRRGLGRLGALLRGTGDASGSRQDGGGRRSPVPDQLHAHQAPREGGM